MAMASSTQYDVVLIGDSITEHLAGTDLNRKSQPWEKTFKIFQKMFARSNGGEVEGLALGIGGDRVGISMND